MAGVCVFSVGTALLPASALVPLAELLLSPPELGPCPVAGLFQRSIV